MQIEVDGVKISDNTEEQRYEALLNGYIAFAEYHLSSDGTHITFVHTEAPDELRGTGVASKLITAALDDARARHLIVIPVCPYVVSFIKRHQEYLDLVDEKHRASVQSA